ncbi:hypothetical protein VM1G_08101 [Cytospora mali]|uniref:Uncharacterized protein n=1 Tax=Cytospora mali TaxID=578113 RepID=A0A194W6B1_CYTMA|nr:hypothetical protein VM1G_08101 [Valsa mali]
MRCSILLVAVMASTGLTAPVPRGPTQLSPTTKRIVGDRGLHYADISADDDAILYRWVPGYVSDNGEPEKETGSEETTEEAQG